MTFCKKGNEKEGIPFKTLDKIRASLEVIPTVSFLLTFIGGLVTKEVGPGSWIIVDNVQFL